MPSVAWRTAGGWPVALTGIGAAVAVAAAAPVPSVRTVAVVGTEFRITLTDGRTLAQEELVGVVLLVGRDGGEPQPLRIDAVTRDADDPTGEIVLYALSAPDAADGTWRNICEPDIDGRRLGFPLPGAWTANGTYHPDAPGLSITCTAGAQGKCVRFGYKPWATLPDGTAMLPYYQACTRAVRADYCGDGVGHTRDGTAIDIFDTAGIQVEEAPPGMTFEAAWGPEGALCLERVRIPELASLAAIAAACPQLKVAAPGESCRTAPGAIVFNAS